MSGPIPVRRAIAAAVALVTLGPASRGASPIPGVAAIVARPVYPVLIRNSVNPLLRVTIDIGKADPSDVFLRNDVRLTSLTFSLAGTDRLSDLASLQVYFTGESGELAPWHWKGRRIADPPRTPVGSALRPGQTLTFDGEGRLLRGGPNVFWLSCRLADWADLSDRIQVACTTIETSAGSLHPADPPTVRERIGLALRTNGDDGVNTYAIPALTTTASGALLAVYDMRWRYPGHDLQDEITTGLSRSTDGGRTWEPVRIIMDMRHFGGLPPNQNGCSDPGILADRQTGEIFCFATWMHGRPGHHQWLGNGSAPGYAIGETPQFLMVTSRDDGRTWSAPQNLTREIKPAAWWLVATAPGHGLQLEDGTLVMPVGGRDASGAMFGTIMVSRDHGAHWRIGTPAILGCAEPKAVELGDGSIMLNLRNEYLPPRYRAVFVTRDLGRTWRAHPTNLNTLPDPQCSGSILRVNYRENGRSRHVLLFANPRSTTKGQRVDQTIQVSFDDGMTWPQDHDILLDEGLGWGYPSLAQIDARHIGIVYGGSKANVTFQIISLEELLHPRRPARLGPPS